MLRRLLSLTCLRYLLLSALGAVALPAIVQGFRPVAEAPAPRAHDATVSRAGYVLLALDQVVLPVEDYLRTGDPAERDGFEQQLRQLQARVATLEASDDPDVRRVAGLLRGQINRLEAMGRSLVQLPAPSNEIAATTGVERLAALRDEVLLAASDLREIEAKHVGEKASERSTIRWIVGGGFLGLGLSLVAGIGLARFAVA
jgi:hypothetical protein